MLPTQTEYTARLSGTGGRLFADPQPTPDETSFQVDNTSKRYFDSPYYKRHSEDLQPVPKPSTPQPQLTSRTSSTPRSST